MFYLSLPLTHITAMVIPIPINITPNSASIVTAMIPCRVSVHQLVDLLCNGQHIPNTSLSQDLKEV